MLGWLRVRRSKRLWMLQRKCFGRVWIVMERLMMMCRRMMMWIMRMSVKSTSFSLKFFTEDSELRCYYEKNCESGEFSCLVCVGIGQKVGKKFKDCVVLVQHSITIAKTKKRQAHRALGKVICKVLGWEIQKLPSINLPKISDSEGNGPHDPNEVVQDKNDSVGEVLPDSSVNLTTDVGSELMVCEDSLMASDGNKSVDTFLNDIPSTPKK